MPAHTIKELKLKAAAAEQQQLTFIQFGFFINTTDSL
jgi:hypothetical protein